MPVVRARAADALFDKTRVEHAGGHGPRRAGLACHRRRRRETGQRRLWQGPSSLPTVDPSSAHALRPGAPPVAAANRLSHRAAQGHRRGPAPQPREIGERWNDDAAGRLRKEFPNEKGIDRHTLESPGYDAVKAVYENLGPATRALPRGHAKATGINDSDARQARFRWAGALALSCGSWPRSMAKQNDQSIDALSARRRDQPRTLVLDLDPPRPPDLTLTGRHVAPPCRFDR